MWEVVHLSDNEAAPEGYDYSGFFHVTKEWRAREIAEIIGNKDILAVKASVPVISSIYTKYPEKFNFDTWLVITKLITHNDYGEIAP